MQSIDLPTLASNTSREIEDFSDYCRLCLQLPNECDLLDLQLVYDEEENLSYYDCFKICAQMDLRSGGAHTPHQLCKSCGLELQVAYDFYKKVEESKKFLLQLEKSASASTKETDLQLLEEITSDMEDKIKVETKLLIPVHVESEALANVADLKVDPADYSDVSIEYEELEEHVDVLEEYQAVEELVDEDAGTVQIIIVEKANLSDDSKNEIVSPILKNQLNPRTSISEAYTKPKNDNITTNESETHTNIFEYDDETNPILFNYESTASECETTIKKPTTKNTKVQSNEVNDDFSKTYNSTDLNSIVITKKGDIRPRQRFTGEHNCDYCQKVFKNRSRMLAHRRFHEPDRPRFECEECGRHYATKQAKGVHVNTVHNKSGLKCTICDKVFAVKRLLEVHMRYHTGDFPYVCNICGRKFAQICHLNTHINVKHNSERYPCEHPGCGKFFTSSTSLRNHEFSHSEMPFECIYCKRGYPSKSKIKVHIRQKHGIEVSLEQIEEMRKFHVTRSKLNMVKILDPDAVFGM